MMVQWMTAFGTMATSEVLTTFEDDGKTLVIVRVARGRYDAALPYAVLDMDDCIPED